MFMYSSCVSIYSVEIHNKEYMQKMIKLSMSCNNSEKKHETGGKGDEKKYKLPSCL